MDAEAVTLTVVFAQVIAFVLDDKLAKGIEAFANTSTVDVELQPVIRSEVVSVYTPAVQAVVIIFEGDPQTPPSQLIAAFVGELTLPVNVTLGTAQVNV